MLALPDGYIEVLDGMIQKENDALRAQRSEQRARARSQRRR